MEEIRRKLFDYRNNWYNKRRIVGQNIHTRRYHTSFLISVPDLSDQLAGLSQMLEQRLASYSRLASLSGRLDLLMSQVAGTGGSGRGDQLMKPMHTYTEQ